MTQPALTNALRETLALFDDAGTPLTTSEVADRLDVGRRSTYERLDRLVDCGHVETKKVGARGRVWWRSRSDEGGDADGMYSRLVGNVPGVVYRCRNEPGWPMSFVSEAATAVTGYDPAAITSDDVSWGADVVHPDDRTQLREDVNEQLEDGDRFSVEYRILTAGGDVRWVRERGYAVGVDGDGHDVLEGVMIDVTEEERSKRSLAEREQQFRSLVEATEEYAIYMLDTDGRIRTWNRGARTLKGYEEDEVVGEHFSAFYTPEDREDGVPERNLASALERGDIEDEGWRVRKDGTRFWAHVTITAIHDEHGEHLGFSKVTRDMTERREHEQQLRRERDLVEQVFETSPVGLGVLSRDGLERVNRRAAEIYGSPTDDVEGYVVGEPTVYDVDGEPVPPEERPNARVFDIGEPVEGWECQLEGVDGQRRWLSVSAAPILEEGEVKRVVVATEDVSRLKEQARRLERQRDELESELEEVFDRVDDAFLALDSEFRFIYANERAEQFLGASEEELLGESVWESYPEARDTPAWAALHEAIETQEPTEFDAYDEEHDRWVEANVYPSESGLSVYFRDVTGRKARERRLAESERRYRTLAENFPNGGVALFGPDLRYDLVAGAIYREHGIDTTELVGTKAGERFSSPEVAALLTEKFRVALAGEGTDFEFEWGDRTLHCRAVPITDEDGDVFAGMAVYQDVTERQEGERELERYRRIVETVEDGIYVVDPDGRFTMVNEGYARMTGYAREELVGMSVTSVVAREVAEEAGAIEGELVAGEREAARIEADLRTADGGVLPAEATFSILEGAEGGRERIGVVRDVTERQERERELETRIEQEEAVAALGRRALEARDLDDFVAEAAELVAETLDNDYCEVLELDEDGKQLRLRQGVGWDDGLVGTATISAVDDDSQAAYTLRTDGPVVVEDLATESRFGGHDLLRDHDVKSGITIVVGTPEDPWGILGTHDREETQFSSHDVRFVGTVANVLATAIARREYEQRLVRQRARLAALNDLNDVVRSITAAAIEQSTREEIEAVVCEGLAATDSYEFAWIGDVDPEGRTIRLRTEAGVEGYLDDAAISIDPDDPRGGGPTGVAVRTHELQVSRDVIDDDPNRPWHEHARKRGFQSSAAIPLVHGGVLFGVLNVFADRPDAFSGDEHEVIGYLGEITAHAIAAIEHKRALTSDEVVELEFQIPNVFDAFDLPTSGDGRIVLDRSIPMGDGTYLAYGRVSEDLRDVLEGLVETLQHWESVRLLGDAPAGSDSRFELRLVDPPVLTAVTDLGGYVERAAVEGGDYFMEIHLAPSVDARQLTELVREEYPMAQLIARRQIARSADSLLRLSDVFAEHLTERQRAALESAYFAGYFEWPRDASGQDVAETLGVSAPTFHQHLRAAQRKVLQVALEDVGAA